MIKTPNEFRDAARQVLLGNHVGGWTKPSLAQYPHQWNWDSGFISLGWLTFDWNRAAAEIEAMLGAQWRNGMVPHVRYDRAHLADYFPGPDRWPGMERHAPEGELTSGISNPPILALAARRVGELAPDPASRSAFWQRVVGPLSAWLAYFFAARRLPGCPLVAVVHPWETGWDNSPRWDRLRQAGLKPHRPYQRLDTRAVAVEERPTGRDYDSYIALAEIISAGDFDLARYRAKTPFLVYDALFDALVYRAAREVNLICEGLQISPAVPETELAEFARAYEEIHWNSRRNTYLDWDAVTGDQIDTPSAAGIAALVGGLGTPARTGAVAEAYLARSGRAEPICSVPPGAETFDPNSYWRGPIWVNVNWLVIEALRGHGLDRAASSLSKSTLRLIQDGGFAEYYNPVDRSPRGSQRFSWTAALSLDLLSHPPITADQ